MVFATSDRALIALAPELARFVDKRQLEGLARLAGLSMPHTVAFGSLDELHMAVDDIGFPVIVKPHMKTPGGPIATRIDSREQLENSDLTEGLVQPFSAGGMQAIAGVMWKGRLVAAVQQRYVRTFPADAGTASLAVTCSEDVEMLAHLELLLAEFDGIFQAQFVGEHLIDLNPRPYGSMSLATAAGVNFPHILCRLHAGEDLTAQHAKTGVSYRWIDGDYRSLLASVRSGNLGVWSALVAVLPKAGTTHSVASFDDLRPLVVRVGRLMDRLHG
jgi:predicted ATP-grasp superfamily ATP-dependent carboligase